MSVKNKGHRMSKDSVSFFLDQKTYDISMDYISSENRL